MITNEFIRQRLLEEISARNETVAALAQKLDIDPKRISNYLEGKERIALDTFANLCKILEVVPSYILGISERERL